jgi:hypothetical protein
MTRACRFLAAQTPIELFLDLGSGLPVVENAHNGMRLANPRANVVYVDNDPVLAYGRALLARDTNTHFVSADVFNLEEVLNHPAIREHIDFGRPLALLQFGTLHRYAGAKDGPAMIMRRYISALPSDSYVAISHFSDAQNECSELARRMEEIFLHSPMGSGILRTHDELLELLPGLKLVAPGLVRCAEWQPDDPRRGPLSPPQHWIAGAVACKP